GDLLAGAVGGLARGSRRPGPPAPRRRHGSRRSRRRAARVRLALLRRRASEHLLPEGDGLAARARAPGGVLPARDLAAGPRPRARRRGARAAAPPPRRAARDRGGPRPGGVPLVALGRRRLVAALRDPVRGAGAPGPAPARRCRLRRSRARA